MKGHSPWNKGLKNWMSDEAKQSSISKKKGQKHSEEHNKKISESKKGHIVSLETRMKIGKANKGHSSWRKGLTSETDERVRLSAIKISKSRKGLPSPKKGTKISEDTRKKMSLSKKGHVVTDETRKKIGMANRGKKRTKERVERFCELRKHIIIPHKDAKTTEIALQNELIRRNIQFTKHKAIIGQPDIFIEPNICIFADGCYFHGCNQCFNQNKFGDTPIGKKIKYTQIRDPLVTQKLLNDGYIVLRFWEHDIRKDVSNCVDEIISFIKCPNNEKNRKIIMQGECYEQSLSVV